MACWKGILDKNCGKRLWKIAVISHNLCLSQFLPHYNCNDECRDASIAATPSSPLKNLPQLVPNTAFQAVVTLRESQAPPPHCPAGCPDRRQPLQAGPPELLRDGAGQPPHADQLPHL